MTDKASNGANKFMLGTKGRLTQIFDESGKVTPGTIVAAGPLAVTQVKYAEKDGYAAVQVGFDSRKEKNMSAPLKGHLKGLTMFRYLREFPGRAGAPDGAVQRGGA